MLHSTFSIAHVKCGVFWDITANQVLLGAFSSVFEWFTRSCDPWIGFFLSPHSVPDEGSASEDRSAPPSPEDRDSGLFLLKKDSERRAILYKVLNEDQDKVISNLMENHIQARLSTSVCLSVSYPISFSPFFLITSPSLYFELPYVWVSPWSNQI